MYRRKSASLLIISCIVVGVLEFYLLGVLACVKCIVHDGRLNIHVLAEHGGRIDGINAKCFALAKKRCASLEAGQVLNGVEIDGRLLIELNVEVGKREAHNLLRFSLPRQSAKAMTAIID